MKQFNQRIKVLPAIFMLLAFSSFAQQKFTHTASKENISCNSDCTVLDIAELNNNPSAILFADPVAGKGATPYQHLISAYYFKDKWHILNLDTRPIPVGTKFTVSYFTNPDDKHFQYSFTKSDIQADGSALIDHPSLNNNPSARFISFPSWDPLAKGGLTNRDEISMQYNTAAGRWSVSNTNRKPMFARVTYNISLESPGNPATNSPPIVTDKVSLPINELIGQITPASSVTGPVIYMYMSVWADGIKLPGETIRAKHLGSVEISDFVLNTLNPTGAGSRKRSYDPLIVKKLTGGAATIPYFNAYIKSQDLVITIDAVSTSQSAGQEELNYTIRLSGARFAGFKQYVKENVIASKAGDRDQYLDEIRIIFTKIEFIKGSVTVTDTL